MARSQAHIVCAALVGVTLACEAERPPQLVADRDAAPVADGQAPTADGSLETEGFRPDGQWLLYMQDRYCLYAAGQSTDFLVWVWYLVDLSPLGPGATRDQLYLRQRMKMCAEEQSPVVGGLQTFVPAAIPANLPERTVDAFALGREPGDAWISQELVELWGLSEEVGVDEPLPESPDDPRVVDQDGDGEPGVTLTVGNNFCDVRIVQRTRYRLSGELVSGHRIEGALWSEVDKNILSATLPFCAASSQLEPRPDGSLVVVQRVDGKNGGVNLDADNNGAVDCAEILAGRDRLVSSGVISQDRPDPVRCR